MPVPPAMSSRDALRRRLGSLAVLEAANIPLQAFIWFGLIGLPATWPNLTGFTLFVILLIQGAAYWAAKLDQLRHRRPHPRGLPAFALARKLNPALLAAGLPATGAAVLADPGAGSWPGLGFALFTVLEHVNYFHVQLMHDTAADLRRLRTAGLRRSQLARDLARVTR